MTEAPTQTIERPEVFGVGTREGVLRRLVAAAIAGWLFPPTSLLAVPIAYLGALPLSLVLESRWPGRPGRPAMVRYGGLGALLGGVVVIVLSLLGNQPGRWAIAAVAIGAASGGVGAGVASVLPARWVLPGSVLGTLLTVGMIGAVAVAVLPALGD